MKVIKFRRLNKTKWEIAFTKADLNEKLNGEMAEIVMPSKSIFIRAYRYFYPLVANECKVSTGL